MKKKLVTVFFIMIVITLVFFLLSNVIELKDRKLEKHIFPSHVNIKGEKTNYYAGVIILVNCNYSKLKVVCEATVESDEVVRISFRNKEDVIYAQYDPEKKQYVADLGKCNSSDMDSFEIYIECSEDTVGEVGFEYYVNESLFNRMFVNKDVGD